MDVDLASEIRGKLTELDGFMAEQRSQMETFRGRLEKFAQRGLTPPGFGARGVAETLGSRVVKAEKVKALLENDNLRGTAVAKVEGRLLPVHNKAIITVGGGSGLKPDVMQAATIAELPSAPVTVPDLIPSRPTTAGAVSFVRQIGDHATAGIQINQGDVKAEASLTFETVELIPQTLAVWIAASRQALQDVSGLELLIDTELLAAILRLEENEILNGTGGVGHLQGILPLATAVAGVAGDSPLDSVARLLGALSAQGITPTGLVLNPGDWLKITLQKTEQGEYLLGSPATATAEKLWGVSLALTPAIAAGTILAGNFTLGAELVYAETANVQISTEHSDFFTRNLCAIRGEERVLLAVRQPSYFAKTTIPATVQASERRR